MIIQYLDPSWVLGFVVQFWGLMAFGFRVRGMSIPYPVCSTAYRFFPTEGAKLNQAPNSKPQTPKPLNPKP